MATTPDPAQLASAGRREIRAAVHRLTADPGDPPPGSLETLAALRYLGAAVIWAKRDAARDAREKGQSWSDIGEAMGYADGTQPGLTSVAERAFLAVAEDLGSGPSAAWRCLCGALIIDHGPEAGGPAESETGHAEDCPRHTADLTAARMQG
jgi:hypothetical protein